MRSINTFIENTVDDGNLDISILSEEFSKMINDLSGGIYYTGSGSVGIEGGAEANVTFGATTTTISRSRKGKMSIAKNDISQIE